jgi:hypothetical protein
MHSSHLDALARTLDARSRRRVAASLSGVALAVMASTRRPPRVAAKKRHKKKAQDTTGRECPTCQTCPAPPTVATCADLCGTCTFCFTQADGPHLCGRYVGYSWEYDCEPDSPNCTSNNDCVGTTRPYCLTHIYAYDPRSGTFEDAGTPCSTAGGRCVKINYPCAA